MTYNGKPWNETKRNETNWKEVTIIIIERKLKERQVLLFWVRVDMNLARELKITMEHESDGDTNSKWCTRTVTRVETIRTTVLLRSAKILRRVWETWGDLLSLKIYQLILVWKILKRSKYWYGKNISSFKHFWYNFDDFFACTCIVFLIFLTDLFEPLIGHLQLLIDSE